jgi:hypothetical protein
MSLPPHLVAGEGIVSLFSPDPRPLPARRPALRPNPAFVAPASLPVPFPSLSPGSRALAAEAPFFPYPAHFYAAFRASSALPAYNGRSKSAGKPHAILSDPHPDPCMLGAESEDGAGRGEQRCGRGKRKTLPPRLVAGEGGAARGLPLLARLVTRGRGSE